MRGDDQTVRLLELTSGREVRRFPGFSVPVLSLAVAQESGVFVTGGGYYVSGERHTAVPKKCWVQVWSLEDGQERARFEGHREPVNSVAISADGRRVLSACGHDRVRCWDVPGQRSRGLFGDSNGNAAVAMTPDGKRGAHIAQGRDICLLDLEKGMEVRRLEGMTARGRVLCLQLAADGVHAISGSAHVALENNGLTPLECNLRLWDLERGRELKRFEGHGAAIRACACSRDGGLFLSGGGTGVLGPQGVQMYDCSVRLWDASTGAELHTFNGHIAPVVAVDISPDGRLGLSAGEDGALCLWRLSP